MNCSRAWWRKFVQRIRNWARERRQKFRFDILMDIGGFRDMHRHRRCVQIGQSFTTAHGYDVPEEYEAAGFRAGYESAMKRAVAAIQQLADRPGAEAAENAQYLIPL